MKYGLKKLVLSDASRKLVLTAFPPLYETTFGKHITLEHGPLSSQENQCGNVEIIGYQKSSYLEVLVVSLDGSCTRDSDKQKKGIPPVHSNDVLKEMLFEKISPIKIEVIPETVYF